MFGGKLYTKGEMQEILDNTKGFFDYCNAQEQIEQDVDRHGAFSWLFNPSFIPLPIDPDHMNKLSKSDIWWINKKIGEALDRAWNTPREHRDDKYENVSR